MHIPGNLAPRYAPCLHDEDEDEVKEGLSKKLFVSFFPSLTWSFSMMRLASFGVLWFLFFLAFVLISSRSLSPYAGTALRCAYLLAANPTPSVLYGGFIMHLASLFTPPFYFFTPAELCCCVCFSSPGLCTSATTVYIYVYVYVYVCRGPPSGYLRGYEATGLRCYER